ncbi:MAG: c-type cytochrome [Burkholderiaceae bacterium]|nr:c-type cytochrome [Burkholderiaceae bacterium]
MHLLSFRRGPSAVGVVFILLLAPLAARALDADAAQALVKKSDCLKCHAVDKKKDGPSYKEVAAKYKGKPDAEQRLFTHVTTNPKVKIDGKEEEHNSLKTKDEAEVRNVIQWILSR